MTSEDQLKELTKNEKRFLSKRLCAWCEMPLNRIECGALFGECSDETRVTRRNNCLKTYKPRKR